MTDALLSLTIAAVTDPVSPANPQRDVGRAFLLLTVLIIVGVLLVLGVILAGFAYFARSTASEPKREDRTQGIDAWAESARRAEEEQDNEDAEDDEDWEVDEDTDQG